MVLPLKSVGVTDFPLGETVRPMLSALENPSLKLFCWGRNIENGRHEGKWKYIKAYLTLAVILNILQYISSA